MYTYRYYRNMYRPDKLIRRLLSRLIYRYADARYGAKARGEVRGFKIIYTEYGNIGISDLTPRQDEMLAKWHWWMNVKCRVYDVCRL